MEGEVWVLKKKGNFSCAKTGFFGTLVSQAATSRDIEHINKEIVESVKLQFLHNDLVGQKPIATQILVTSDELQNNQKIYSDAESILTDILKNKQYIHSRQIQFLADRHRSDVMKIRFVLHPFSFVFLLSGEQHYHIVLETLDTEEATYIWQTDKSKIAVIESVKRIAQQLKIIRTQGRQAFLDSNPKSFSKILHDYSDSNKGFIVWKSQMEERIN